MKHKQHKQKNTISPEQNEVSLFRDKNTYFAINNDADMLSELFGLDIQIVFGVRTAVFPAPELEAVIRTLVRNQFRVKLFKFLD